MKRIILLSICFTFALTFVYAQYNQQTSIPTVTPPTTWTSKDSTEEVTINNGSGSLLTITINVDKNINELNPAGINIINCGNTTHVDAGSTAICTTSDSTNPVIFSSDNPTKGTSGTYTVKH